MYCPILSTNHKDPNIIYVGGTPLIDCLKEECGQYDQANQCCAPVALNQTMVAIGNTLGEIVNQLYNK